MNPLLLVLYTVSWIAPIEPVAKYTIYRETLVGWAVVDSTPQTTWKGSGLLGGDKLRVTATGLNGQESEPSASVVIPLKWVHIKTSKDLKTWETIQVLPLYEEGVSMRFIRAELSE